MHVRGLELPIANIGAVTEVLESQRVEDLEGMSRLASDGPHTLSCPSTKAVSEVDFKARRANGGCSRWNAITLEVPASHANQRAHFVPIVEEPLSAAIGRAVETDAGTLDFELDYVTR